jgi:transcription initiation factor TFIIE subunit alpha
MEDDSFHCENCNGELVMECNKLISEEVVDRGDNARRRQREKVKVWLQDLEVCVYCFSGYFNESMRKTQIDLPSLKLVHRSKFMMKSERYMIKFPRRFILKYPMLEICKTKQDCGCSVCVDTIGNKM